MMLIWLQRCTVADGYGCAWMQGRLTQTSAGMLLGCLEVLMEDAVTSAGKS